MANETHIIAGWAARLPGAVADNLTDLFGPQSRFFLPYLAASVLVAAIAHFAVRRGEPKDGARNFANAILRPDLWRHPSSIVDLKVIFANRVFSPLLALTGRSAMVLSAYLTAVLLTGSDPVRPDATISAPAIIVMTLSVLIVSDFTTYWVHRLHHEHPVLWPFHKLHHSAEVMTPLTFARKHPVYDLFRGLSNAILVGPAQGVVLATFGVTDAVTILGVNIFYAAFHWSGSNLRHSHFWIDYGPFWSRIFISPAQHQIHHSCAVRHHDKNYGEVFALWDWIFGTLYSPSEYEALEYGVADETGARLDQPHPTLKDAWLVPFAESAEAIRKTSEKPIKASA